MAELHNNSRAARAEGTRRTLSAKQAGVLGNVAYKQTIISSAIEGKFSSRKAPLKAGRQADSTR